MDNLGTAIKEAFGPDNWQELEAEYESGKLTAEQNTIRQFGLMDATQDDIEEFVKGDVVVRFSFDEFVGHCEGEGIRLAIVSSGIRPYVDAILELVLFQKLEVHAAEAEFTPNGIQVKYIGPSGESLESGFKAAWTDHFKAEGYTVIYVGDGLSDLEAAKKADHVIARSGLATEMERLDLPFKPFDHFEDVGEWVQEIHTNLADS